MPRRFRSLIRPILFFRQWLISTAINPVLVAIRLVAVVRRFFFKYLVILIVSFHTDLPFCLRLITLPLKNIYQLISLYRLKDSGI